MKYRKNVHGMGDVDREDFFQIHTYMSYYQNYKEKELLGGGLLYPIEGELKEDEKADSSFWGNNNEFFIIDGIDLSNLKILKEAEELSDSYKIENLLDFKKLESWHTFNELERSAKLKQLENLESLQDINGFENWKNEFSQKQIIKSETEFIERIKSKLKIQKRLNNI